MKNDTFHHLRNPRAETLAEVIIAFVVFGIVGTAGILFLVNGLDVNQEAEERLVAYNFAREGVEAVRNLRDTNWLRFPGNRTECWDVSLDTTSSLDCGTATKIGSRAVSGGTDYLVYPEIAEVDELFSWNFVPIPNLATADLSLYETTVGASATPLYTQGDGCGASCTASPYRRYVNVVSKDDNGDGLADVLTVTATVTWESDADTRSVTFMDELTNY